MIMEFLIIHAILIFQNVENALVKKIVINAKIIIFLLDEKETYALLMIQKDYIMIPMEIFILVSIIYPIVINVLVINMYVEIVYLIFIL
jgi:hypothetical protein